MRDGLFLQYQIHERYTYVLGFGFTAVGIIVFPILFDWFMCEFLRDVTHSYVNFYVTWLVHMWIMMWDDWFLGH